MILFFAEEIQDDYLILRGEDYKHCATVLRHSVGDLISVTDGNGNKYLTKIAEISKSEIVAEIEESTKIAQRNSMLSIATAIPKNAARFEWFVEKTTEIGISTIIPLITSRSERKRLNMIRCRKKIKSASLQSLQYHFPKISEPINLKTYLETHIENELIVAHYHEANHSLDQVITREKEYTIIIGPEGDFTKDELAYFTELNLAMINLGQNRLRTETAGIVACTIFQHFNG